MSVGDRVAKLRAAHGESLREASLRTGVSHTTIARIEKGEVTASFHSTLRKIAEGYGVKLEYLMGTREPARDFAVSLNKLPPEQRQQLYFADTRRRIKIVLDFLMGEYAAEFPMDHIAQQAGIPEEELEDILERWYSSDLSPDLYLRIAEALSRLTGISRHWFEAGTIESGGGALGDMDPAAVPAYLNLMKKAAEANITPEILDMAIDLLILRRQGMGQGQQPG